MPRVVDKQSAAHTPPISLNAQSNQSSIFNYENNEGVFGTATDAVGGAFFTFQSMSYALFRNHGIPKGAIIDSAVLSWQGKSSNSLTNFNAIVGTPARNPATALNPWWQYQTPPTVLALHESTQAYVRWADRSDVELGKTMDITAPTRDSYITPDLSSYGDPIAITKIQYIGSLALLDAPNIYIGLKRAGTFNPDVGTAFVRCVGYSGVADARYVIGYAPDIASGPVYTSNPVDVSTISTSDGQETFFFFTNPYPVLLLGPSFVALEVVTPWKTSTVWDINTLSIRCHQTPFTSGGLFTHGPGNGLNLGNYGTEVAMSGDFGHNLHTPAEVDWRPYPVVFDYTRFYSPDISSVVQYQVDDATYHDGGVLGFKVMADPDEALPSNNLRAHYRGSGWLDVTYHVPSEARHPVVQTSTSIRIGSDTKSQGRVLARSQTGVRVSSGAVSYPRVKAVTNTRTRIQSVVRHGNN